MATTPQDLPEIHIHPADAGRWADLETLFGEHGAYAGCWCMFWRLPHPEFNRLKGEGTKLKLRELSASPLPPGILAYADGKAIGWCSIGPREHFQGLERSRILKRVDEKPVWSVVCYFIHKKFRRQGVMEALLRGAIGFARQHGAKIIEGYPIDTHSPLLEGKKLTGYSGFMGIAAAYRAVGFVEVARASETQAIMRYELE